LIDSTINCNRLLGTQRRIAKACEAALKSAFTETFKKRCRPEAIAHVRTQLRSGRRDEVGNRSIAGNRTLRVYLPKKTWTIGSPYREPLFAGADRNLQAAIKQYDLVLCKNRVGALTVGGSGRSAKRRHKSLKQRLPFKLKSGRHQI
jgi:hypothetical protein